jgi:L-asparaginase II
MANPVLVEITRGPLVESVHRGAIAVVGEGGRILASVGDVDTPIYPRSALKPVQAVPLLESGAAEAFSLTDEEVALACASHSGEAMHTARVAAWLARIGCSVDDLACGPHELRDPATVAAMRARHEQPTPIHNNCSGKHTGFLTLARHLGAPVKGYVGIGHPVQQAVARTLRDLAGLEGDIPWGVDGCTAPNFALPLVALARAMARFAAPEGLKPERIAAMRRIVRAMTAHPELVAGTGRVCTLLMRQAPGRLLVKTGAEGVFVAVLLDRRLGVALKIDDGATRAAETLIAAILIALGAVGDEGPAHGLAHAPVLNTRDAVVGERRPVSGLIQSVLSGLGGGV